MSDNYSRYKIEGKDICFYRGNEYVPFARAIKILKVYRIVDSDKSIRIKIGFVDLFGEIHYKTITPSELTNSTSLLKMIDLGMDVNENNVKEIISYFNYSLQEADFEVVNLHSKLGFVKDKDKVFFKHYNIISDDVVNEEISQSTYNGKLDLKPEGDIEEYKKFLIDEIKDSPSLQLACALGLTAPIHWIVTTFDTEIENLIVNIAGHSSSGKSTVLMLAMSLWGCCDVTSNNKSLIKNFNSTSNALLKDISINGFQGVPIALDEVGMSNIRDFSKFIYTISSGMDKNRLTSSSELMDMGTFKSVVLCSGELSMRLNHKSKTMGSYLVRLLEFHNVPWTCGAQQSNRIKSFVSKNYGTFGPSFIETIIDDFDLITNNWTYYVELIKERVIEKVGKYGERLSMKFALILTAYDILMSILELDSKEYEGKVINLLIETLDGMEEDSDLSRKAYDCIMNEISENNSNYISYTDTRYTTVSNVGESPARYKTYGKQCKSEYVITRQRFDKVLLSSGFKDIKSILAEWMEKGVLVPEKTSQTRINPYNRRNINGDNKVAVVVIRKGNVYEELNDKNNQKEELNHIKPDEEVDMNEYLFEDE